MDWSLFDPAERALLRDALPHASDVVLALERQVYRLEKLAAVARREDDDVTPETLLERLADARYDIDLRLPAVATVARAFVLHKIDFFRAIVAAVERDVPLRRRAEVELAQSIHSYLVEELFLSVAADAEVPPEVRRGAARKVIMLWRSPVAVEVDDVAPLLDAIWEARRRMQPVLGTLLGTAEIFALFQNARDERFLEHFAEGDLPEEEVQAYREFLFGLSTEDHDRLRAEMDARGVDTVSLADARAWLGLPPARPAAGADVMVSSYRARRIKASYRAMVGAPGPRRTAEEHVVIARLARGDAL